MDYRIQKSILNPGLWSHNKLGIATVDKSKITKADNDIQHWLANMIHDYNADSPTTPVKQIHSKLKQSPTIKPQEKDDSSFLSSGLNESLKNDSNKMQMIKKATKRINNNNEESVREYLYKKQVYPNENLNLSRKSNLANSIIKSIDPIEEPIDNNNNITNTTIKSILTYVTSNNWLSEENKLIPPTIKNTNNAKHEEQSSRKKKKTIIHQLNYNINNDESRRESQTTNKKASPNISSLSTKRMKPQMQMHINRRSLQYGKNNLKKLKTEYKSKNKNEIDLTQITEMGRNGNILNPFEGICNKLKQTLFYSHANIIDEWNNNDKNKGDVHSNKLETETEIESDTDMKMSTVQLKRCETDKYRIIQRKEWVYDSCDDEENDDEIKDTFYISSTSTSWYIYEMIITILTFYSVICTPVFLFSDSCYDIQLLSTQIDIIIDMVLILDIFVNCFISYTTLDDIVIISKKDIIINYLMSWFIIDLISAIPFNSYFIYLYKDKVKRISRMIGSISVNKYKPLQLVRTVKIFKTIFNNKFMKYCSEKLYDNLSNTILIKLLVYFVYYLIIQHIWGCLFIVVSQTSNRNWINTYLPNQNDLISVYVSGSYFILATISSIGYGDWTMVSFNEKVFNLFLMIFGVLWYSFAITSISTHIQNIDSKETGYMKKWSMLEEIRRFHDNMPPILYDKINRFWKYDNKNNSIDKNMVLNCLPIGWKNNWINEMYKPIINNFVFFKDYKNSDFMVRVVLAFKPIISARNEVLVKEGDFIEEIIFVKDGVLSLQWPLPNLDLNKIPTGSIMNTLTQQYHGKKHRQNKEEYLHNFTQLKSLDEQIYQQIMKMDNHEQKVYAQILEIRKNEHFGEILMFLNKRSPWSVKVKSKKIELFFLSKTDAVEISTSFPQIWDDIQAKSFYNMEQIQKLIHKIMKFFIKSNWKRWNQILKKEFTNKLIKKYDITEIHPAKKFRNFASSLHEPIPESEKPIMYKGKKNWSLIGSQRWNCSKKGKNGYWNNDNLGIINKIEDSDDEDGYGNTSVHYLKKSKKRKKVKTFNNNNNNNNKNISNDWQSSSSSENMNYIDFFEENFEEDSSSVSNGVYDQKNEKNFKRESIKPPRDNMFPLNNNSVELTERKEHNYNNDYSKFTVSSIIETKCTRTTNPYSIVQVTSFTVDHLYDNIYTWAENNINKVKHIIKKEFYIDTNTCKSSEKNGKNYPKSEKEVTFQVSKKKKKMWSKNQKSFQKILLQNSESTLEKKHSFHNKENNIIGGQNGKFGIWRNNSGNKVIPSIDNQDMWMKIKNNIAKNKQNLENPAMFYQECFEELMNKEKDKCSSSDNPDKENDKEENEENEKSFNSEDSGNIKIKSIKSTHNNNNNYDNNNNNNYKGYDDNHANNLLNKLDKTEQLLHKFDQLNHM